MKTKQYFEIKENKLIGDGRFLYNVTRDNDQATCEGLVAGSSPKNAYEKMTLNYWNLKDYDLQNDYADIQDYRIDYPFEDYNFELVGMAIYP